MGPSVTTPPPAADAAPDPVGNVPPPRAFAKGVGLVLQTVGMVLFLSTCCVCVSTGLWNPVRAPTEAVEQASHDLQTPAVTSPLGLDDLIAQPARGGVALLVLGMTVGGLALAAFGLGLQSDRRLGAPGATVTCIVLLLLLALAGLGLWRGEAGVAVRVWHALLLLVIVLLLGFCLAAWQQVRRDPPPVDADVIPPGTKIPYSVYHDDPPEVRLANELAHRRARLEAEQRELERLEDELRERNKNAPDA